jgi:hydrogenase expression/formation protein HypE
MRGWIVDRGRNELSDGLSWQCPPSLDMPVGQVTLLHGEGGRASREFLRRWVHAKFPAVVGAAAEGGWSDAARLDRESSSLAFSTDSFVVTPLFFPGGDIGRLAVVGTANDLAMVGAQPRWLSLSLMIEEGLPLATLDRVLESVRVTSEELSVTVVTGDTKVLPRGSVDQLYLNTSGIGQWRLSTYSQARQLTPGDELLVSGPIGQHGMAVLAARESLGLSSDLQSDCGSLWPVVAALQAENVPYKLLRDATRGGVAAVLHEWAESSGLTMAIDERRIPVSAAVRGMSELLGIDPLFVANEGTMVMAVPAGYGERCVAICHQLPIGRQAAGIGRVEVRAVAPVTVVRALGRPLPLDEPIAALLPRIC